MSQIKLKPADKRADAATNVAPVDPMRAWNVLVEDLIYAATYADDHRTGTKTWDRICDAQQRPYNRARSKKRCWAICRAVNQEYCHLEHLLHRAKAAASDPAFRIRHGNLLPRRPGGVEAQERERRSGITEAQRMANAETAWA